MFRVVPLLTAVLVCALPTAASAQAPSGEPVVRVRLFGGPTLGTARLSSEGAPLTLRMDGAVVATVPAGTSVSVDRSSGGRVNVEGDGLNERGVVLEAEAPGGAVRVEGGRFDRRYRGAVRVTQASSSRLHLVNVAPLEDYVASVTAHEYPFSEIEGVKAQAVLARTYALQRAAPARDHDVDDHEGSQVYHGVGAETAVSREAARATAGQVLRYGGALAEALYSSSNGGHTADNESLWGSAPVPYLRGRPDPYDAESPDHTWRVAVDARRLFDALSAHYGRTTGIAVAARSPEGRAVRVSLTGERDRVVSATDFRSVVNARLGARTLKSTHFAIAMEGGDVVFTGRGHGHGVGMSQYGARGQARAGHTYTDILAFYFAGTSLDVLPHGTGGGALLAGPAHSGAHAGGVTTGRAPVRATPRLPVPIVRGTWGERRTSPTPRAEAHAAEVSAAEAALDASDPPPARTRRASW